MVLTQLSRMATCTSSHAFLCRTIPNIEGHLYPLENCIRSILIPSLTGRPPPNDLERDLLGLPPRLGGLDIINPTGISIGEFSASKSITLPLSNLIKESTPLSASRIKSLQRRQFTNNVKTALGSLRLPLEVVFQLDCREPWTWHRRKEPRVGSLHFH